VLEVMRLDGPLILARDCEGSRLLLAHGETGLLFHTPGEFVHLVRQVLAQPAEETIGMVNAAQRVGSEEDESGAYDGLMREAMRGR
jgi:hypothetical protein